LGERTELLGGHAQCVKQALKREHGFPVELIALKQVGHVQAALQIVHLARQQYLLCELVIVCRVACTPSSIRQSGQKARQTGFLQRHRPGLGQVVGGGIGVACTRVFAQDDAGPIERACQQPTRLGALALGAFCLNGLPLLPQSTCGKRGHQRHGEHGSQQRCAALWGVRGVRHVLVLLKLGRTQSRVMRPRTPVLAGKSSCKRMASGIALGALVLVCGVSGVVPPVL